MPFKSIADAQDGLSNVATTSINKVEDIGKGPTGCTSVPCNNQRYTRTELSDGHLTENDRVDPNEQADSLIDRYPVLILVMKRIKIFSLASRNFLYFILECV